MQQQPPTAEKQGQPAGKGARPDEAEPQDTKGKYAHNGPAQEEQRQTASETVREPAAQPEKPSIKGPRRDKGQQDDSRKPDKGTRRSGKAADTGRPVPAEEVGKTQEHAIRRTRKAKINGPEDTRREKPPSDKTGQVGTEGKAKRQCGVHQTHEVRRIRQTRQSGPGRARIRGNSNLRQRKARATRRQWRPTRRSGAAGHGRQKRKTHKQTRQPGKTGLVPDTQRHRNKKQA